jgi:hypothetical protein
LASLGSFVACLWIYVGGKKDSLELSIPLAVVEARRLWEYNPSQVRTCFFKILFIYIASSHCRAGDICDCFPVPFRPPITTHRTVRQVFGTPFEVMAQREGTDLPRVLVDIAQHFKSHVPNQPWKACENVQLLSWLRTQYDAGELDVLVKVRFLSNARW